MIHTLRTLAAAGLVSASLALWAGPATADEPAVRCPFISVADSSKAAMAVFTGEVVSVTRQDKPEGERGAYFLHDVTVTRVYRGQIDTETVQVRTEKTPKQCSLGDLEVGATYVFFVGSSGDPWVAPSGGGTRVADAEVVDKVVQILAAERLRRARQTGLIGFVRELMRPEG